MEEIALVGERKLYESIERLGNSNECVEIPWKGVIEPPCFLSCSKVSFLKQKPLTLEKEPMQSLEVPRQKQSKANLINETEGH